MSDDTTSATSTPAVPVLPAFVRQQITITPIPGVISKAISKVQEGVKALTKSTENKFGGYNYTSADQIYALIGPLQAEAGLVIFPVELEPTAFVTVETAKGPKQWGKFRIGFVLSVGDVTWFDERASETLFIQIEGAQTFQAAKSYAQKTFLRALLKIPTGDIDLDAQAKDGEDIPKKDGKPVKAKKLLLSEHTSTERRKEIMKELEKLATPLSPSDQTEFAETWGPEIDRLQLADADFIRSEFARLRKGQPKLTRVAGE